MADYTFKVTPEVLESMTSDFTDKVKKAHNAFVEVDELLSKTNQYWEGLGQTALANSFGAQKDYYHKAFDAMEEYSKNLLVMAGLYEEAENNAIETTLSLQSDIF